MSPMMDSKSSPGNVVTMFSTTGPGVPEEVGEVADLSQPTKMSAEVRRKILKAYFTWTPGCLARLVDQTDRSGFLINLMQTLAKGIKNTFLSSICLGRNRSRTDLQHHSQANQNNYLVASISESTTFTLIVMYLIVESGALHLYAFILQLRYPASDEYPCTRALFDFKSNDTPFCRVHLPFSKERQIFALVLPIVSRLKISP